MYRRMVVTVLAVVLAVPLLGGTAVAQDVLSNESVLAMVKAGLSESIIVAKIQSTAAPSRRFDLSSTGLIALKKGGASDRVIEAMLAPPGTPAPAAAAARPADSAATMGSVKLRDRDVIYYVSDGKPVELAALLGEIKTEEIGRAHV